jgi:tetratricopeptide (TPR) repeat protein
MTELPDSIHTEITRLSEQGNTLADAGECDAAVLCFQQALDLLPLPIEPWSAACWLFTAIGDTLFQSARYREALQPLLNAVKCAGGLGNPFVHLRLGQTQLELGNEVRAADELARAYMGGGKEVFEEEDSKYFTFVKSKLRPPVGGW